jgi:group I intron endonuclease
MKQFTAKLGAFEVYLITNLVNDKKYVGITTNGVEYRWLSHVYDSNRKSQKKKINRAIRKYGKDSFKVEHIASSISLEDLQQAEIQLIAQYDTRGHKGYNSTYGGEGLWGYKHSEDTRAKLAQYSRPQSAETRAKISQTLKGKKKSKEHAEKIRMAKIGMKHTEEARKKISESGIGRKWSPERRKKQLAIMIGHPCSEETKEKIRKAAIGRKISKEHLKKMNDGRKLRAEVKYLAAMGCHA